MTNLPNPFSVFTATAGLANAWRASEGEMQRRQPDQLKLPAQRSPWAAAELTVDWTSLLGSPTLSRNVLIHVLASGEAALAGLSFGPFRDFLTPMNTLPRLTRCLQLELDRDLGTISFRVDGALQPTGQWFQKGIGGVESLYQGQLTLKAMSPGPAYFRKLTIMPYQSRCSLSVVITCNRFLQRLRHSLRNWSRQDSPSGSIELIVVNPESPDGLHEHMAAFSAACPHLRVRQLLVPARFARNRGWMVNQGVRASRGAVIWITDSDCLFRPDAARIAIEESHRNPNHLLYCERRYLSLESTQAMLAGLVDGCADFERLRRETLAHHAGPWGYTQIVSRQVLERWPYREDVDSADKSDSDFLFECLHNGIVPRKVDGLQCLHLYHPFAWHGTPVSL